jgi:hypothetical protein
MRRSIDTTRERLQCNDRLNDVTSRHNETLLLHLVDKLVSRNGELVRDYIAHVHEVFQTFFQHLIYTDIVYNILSASCSGAKYKQTYRMSGFANSSLSLKDEEWSNRRIQRQGFRSRQRLIRYLARFVHSLLHDNVSQGIA